MPDRTEIEKCEQLELTRSKAKSVSMHECFIYLIEINPNINKIFKVYKFQSRFVVENWWIYLCMYVTGFQNFHEHRCIRFNFIAFWIFESTNDRTLKDTVPVAGHPYKISPSLFNTLNPVFDTVTLSTLRIEFALNLMKNHYYKSWATEIKFSKNV